MKMIQIMSIIAVGLISSLSYAGNKDSVNFNPKFRGEVPFECTITTKMLTQVTIDTSNVEAKGFCRGPEVTKPGHIKTSADIVNKFYFLVKNGGISPSVTVTALDPNATVRCVQGHTRTVVYSGADGKFCSIVPIKE